MKTKFAITYTVKNESRLLPSAIDYHSAIGCSKFYVYLDGTTDNTVELIKNLENVEIFSTSKPVIDKETPTWITEIMPWWDSDFDVRKRINTYYAAVKALLDDIEWVCCIDPDEILFFNHIKGINSNKFNDLFENILPDIDQIFMKNLEVIASKVESDNPFRDCTLFLNRFPVTEFLWRFSSAVVRRITRRPKIVAWFDYVFYRLRFFNALPRLMFNPITDKFIPCSYFLGYSNHKAFIRTNRCKDFNFVIHKWIKYKRKPKSIFTGNVLHYDFFDYKYMSLKFNQRSVAPHMTKDFYVRDALGTFARVASDDCMKKFFEKNITISDDYIINRLIRKKIAIRVLDISSYFLAKDQ